MKYIVENRSTICDDKTCLKLAGEIPEHSDDFKHGGVMTFKDQVAAMIWINKMSVRIVFKDYNEKTTD